MLSGSAALEPPSGTALPPGGYRALLKGKRILVAEDTPTNQEIILAVLDLAGVKTVLADTGEKAVAQAAASRFHAVLMDLQMPVMDGFEAARAIRKQAHGQDIPIIAMTAHALKEDEARCLAAGMDAYISKPINQEKLFSTLIRHIYATDTDTLPGTEPIPVLNALDNTDIVLPEKLPGIDIGRAMAALSVSSPVFMRILSTFLRDIPSVLKGIKSAWGADDKERVIRLTHSLKGSAGGIGAIKTHDIALEMEILCRNAACLPRMNAAGITELEKAVNEVLTAICTIMPSPESDALPPALDNGGPDTEKLATLLNKLARALEFPELTELDLLLDQLDAFATHSEISRLKDQILSHDYEPARQTVQKLQTIFNG